MRTLAELISAAAATPTKLRVVTLAEAEVPRILASDSPMRALHALLQVAECDSEHELEQLLYEHFAALLVGTCRARRRLTRGRAPLACCSSCTPWCFRAASS